jgi:hypothetical protein
MEDDNLAKADELVVVQELLLKSLAKRKALLTKQRQGMEHRLLVHRQELTSLQSKQASVQHNRTKHADLQAELEQQLRKSEEKLKQFDVSDIEQQPTDSSQSNEAVDLKDDDTKNNDSEEILSNLESDSTPTKEATSKVEEHPASQTKKRKAVENSSLLTAPIYNPFAGKSGILSLFKVQPSSSHLTLHLMVHGKRLERLAELSIEDQTSMDEYKPDARHRREGLFHTCLLPFSVKWENDETATSIQQKEELDPDTPICPYELAGECADPYCVFQHFEKRKVESRKLVKEMLPLPDLQLPAVVEVLGEDATAEQDQEQPSTKRQKVDAPTDETVKETSKESTDEVKKPPTEDFLDFNDDFLSLPTADNDDGDDSDNDQQLGNGPPRRWWMDNDDEVRIDKVWKRGQQVAVLDWMRAVYHLEVQDDTLVCLVACQKLNDRDVLRFLGRLVDALQFVLHAGRYDWGKAVCQMQGQLCRKYINVFPSKQLHTFFATLSQQWKMNNHQQNVCAVALEQHVVLSCISQFLLLQHEHASICLLPAHRDDLEYGTTGKDVLDRIMATHPADSKSTNDFQERIRAQHEQVVIETNDEQPRRKTSREMLLLALQVCEIERVIESTVKSLSLNDLIGRLDVIRSSAEGSAFGAIVQIGLLSTSVVRALATDGVTLKLASKFEAKLDSICVWMHRNVDPHRPDLRLLLTPTLALRVCLLVSMQRYDKAQRALEGYLAQNLGVYSFSDLLWSQLVMLRSRLPTRKQVFKSSQQGTVPQQLTAIITSLGVKLNHLTLVGDRNLFQPFLGCSRVRHSGENIKKWRTKLKTMVSLFMSRIDKEEEASDVTPLINIMDLESMSMGAGKKYPGKLVTLSRLTFPRTLLYGGSSLRRLKLTSCQIQTLPQLFGDYFPNLQVSERSSTFVCRLLELTHARIAGVDDQRQPLTGPSILLPKPHFSHHTGCFREQTSYNS